MIDILASCWTFLANIAPFEIPALPAATPLWVYLGTLLQVVLACYLILKATLNFARWEILRQAAQESDNIYCFRAAVIFKSLAMRATFFSVVSFILAVILPYHLCFFQVGINLGMALAYHFSESIALCELRLLQSKISQQKND